MGIRTPDLLIANETLYQLSYTPKGHCRRGLCGVFRRLAKVEGLPVYPPSTFSSRPERMSKVPHGTRDKLWPEK